MSSSLTPRQKHPIASLHLIPFKQLAPLVLASLPLRFKSLENVILLASDFFIVGRRIIHITENLQCFRVAAVLVQIPR